MLNFFLMLLCRHEVHVNGKLAKGAAVVLFVRGSNPGSLFWGFLFRWCLVLFFLLLLWVQIPFSALRAKQCGGSAPKTPRFLLGFVLLQEKSTPHTTKRTSQYQKGNSTTPFFLYT